MMKKRKENTVFTVLWSLLAAIFATAVSAILMGVFVVRGILPQSGASVYGGIAAVIGSGIAAAVCCRNKSVVISAVTAVSYVLLLAILHMLLSSGEAWRILPVLPCIVISGVLVFAVGRKRKRRIRY